MQQDDKKNIAKQFSFITDFIYKASHPSFTQKRCNLCFFNWVEDWASHTSWFAKNPVPFYSLNLKQSCHCDIWNYFSSLWRQMNVFYLKMKRISWCKHKEKKDKRAPKKQFLLPPCTFTPFPSPLKNVISLPWISWYPRSFTWSLHPGFCVITKPTKSLRKR